VNLTVLGFFALLTDMLLSHVGVMLLGMVEPSEINLVNNEGMIANMFQ
jgi:hypothetical protein